MVLHILSPSYLNSVSRKFRAKLSEKSSAVCSVLCLPDATDILDFHTECLQMQPADTRGLTQTHTPTHTHTHTQTAICLIQIVEEVEGIDTGGLSGGVVLSDTAVSTISHKQEFQSRDIPVCSIQRRMTVCVCVRVCPGPVHDRTHL